MVTLGKRILSLDILRGITVASMILVNNPAVWGGAYAPLRHAFWHGLTPTDLIYPFFVFVMGVSGWFSLNKRKECDGRMVFVHIAGRSIMIFFLGCLLQVFSQWAYGTLAWETFRISGVLQGLAIAYLFGSLFLVFANFRWVLLLSIVLLCGYWLILVLGDGFSLSTDNIIAVVDRAILGEGHMYHERLSDGSLLAFEPESVLSNISRTAQFLTGAYVGKILQQKVTSEERLNRLFIFGVICLFAGFLIQYGCPINKKIWSSSFVMVTTGVASAFLGLLYWIVDMKGKVFWANPLRIFGVNPLFLYAFAWVFSVIVNMKIGGSFVMKKWFYSVCIDPFCGEALGSLVYSLIVVFLVWFAGYILDKKGIYIKL